MLHRLFLIGLVVFTLKTFADATPKEQPTPVAASELPEEKPSSSWIPIVGYDPTYKIFMGGGYFYSAPGLWTGIHGVITFDRVYQIMPHLRLDLGDKWVLGWEFEYSKGFEPYYGEGGNTNVANLVNIWGDKTLTKPTLTFHLLPEIDVGFFVDFRNRWEDDVQTGTGMRYFPNETTVGFGVFQRIDRRDNRDNPSSGYLFGTEITQVPAAFTNIPGTKSFSQIEAEFAIYETTLENVVAAVKLNAGYSIGMPTYLFKYRLGGTNRLRGYLENRFRGSKYYLEQTEARFPIWRFIDGAAFIGFGDATDDNFSGAKMAYGFGFRIGLPPDYINKARIDIGFGKDQSGVFVTFGQAF